MLVGALIFAAAACDATTVVFSGTPGSKQSTAVAVANTALMNETLAQLQKGDVFVIPNKTFTVMGGIYASGLDNVTLQVDGTLQFSTDTKSWPVAKPGSSMPQTCIVLKGSVDLTITSSSGTGTFDGQVSTCLGSFSLGFFIRATHS